MPRASNLYRFWGRTPPSDTRRTAPVRAEAATTTSGEATLYLYGPIDSWGGMWGVSATEVATALTTLPNDITDLTVRINSPGGEVFEAVAIMNLLRDHSARITARVDGLAASAASFLACSADETIMGGNTRLMIHDAWGIAIGNAEEMRAYADLLDNVSDDAADVYAAKAGATREDMRGYMHAESWFSAEEAVALGLADSINTGEEDTAPADSAKAAATMAFDLEALFEYNGRENAPAPAPLPVAPAPEQQSDTPVTAGADLTLRHRMNARKIGVRLT